MAPQCRAQTWTLCVSAPKDKMMKYEVRYIVDNQEHRQTVEVENAADAAEIVMRDHPEQGDSFELIQIQLLDEAPEVDEIESLG